MVSTRYNQFFHKCIKFSVVNLHILNIIPFRYLIILGLVENIITYKKIQENTRKYKKIQGNIRKYKKYNKKNYEKI